MNENEGNVTKVVDDIKQFDKNESAVKSSIESPIQIPVPDIVYSPPKKRKLSKGAMAVYLLIIAVLYALVIFLSVTVSNRQPKIDENQIDNTYLQTVEA